MYRPERILVVDGSAAARYATCRVLSHAGFQVEDVASGEECLHLAQEMPDLIIINVNLPDMDGFELVRLLKDSDKTARIPVLQLSNTYKDTEDKVKGLESGADSYLNQPVEHTVLIATIKALLRMKKAEQHNALMASQWQSIFNAISDGVLLLDNEGRVVSCNSGVANIFNESCEHLIGRVHSDILPVKLLKDLPRFIDLRPLVEEIYFRDQWFEIILDPLYDESGDIIGAVEMIRDVTSRKNKEQETALLAEKFRQAIEGMSLAMGYTLQKGDPYVAEHQLRVARLAEAIARDMGLAEESIQAVKLAAAIHDIGKIYVPSEILMRPGPIDDRDLEVIRKHVQTGYEVIRSIDFPWPVAEMIAEHHERMDGSGYPLGLSGEQIRLEARIIAVADVVVAIASKRPYRPAQSIEKALEEITVSSGILYDSLVVDACLNLFSKGYQL